MTTQRVALVTGGGSGIGRSISLRLARGGTAVVVLDVNGAAAEETVAAMTAGGGRGLAVECDVSDSAAVHAALDRIHAAFGSVQILVNVAGIGVFAPLLDITDADWQRMIAVHLTGTFNCCRAVVPDMLAARWGRIVNTGSVAGLNGGGPGLSHYAAAKGGIIAFTKALAHELGPSGMTVNCIAPGLIDTPMVATSLVSPEIRARAIEGAPMRRIGTPEDVAAVCAFLVSDEASFFTGQVMSPNGGRYM